MIKRLEIVWPDPRPFAGRGGRPIRFLAASDEPEPALREEMNRDALGHLDAIVGCGDLEPEWLRFLGDAFNLPLIYVRGNHDRSGGWREDPLQVPAWLDPGQFERLAGIPVVGLEWPGIDMRDNRRRPWLAWRQTIRTTRRLVMTRQWSTPLIVISHVPPAGVGDVATDAYHVGFDGYRWLLDRLSPPIWLHGHSTVASVPRLVERSGSSIVANVTGALLVELRPPG